jgi:sugar porter (SP) family MFS transporter
VVAQGVSDTLGRRMTFVLAAIGFLLGIIVMISTSHSFTVLLIGRMLVGWGVGIGLAIDPLYISEITPAKYRGELVTWSEILLNVGIVFGFSTGLFLSHMDDDMEWRVMFLLGAILPVIMIFVVWWIMPESPRWLVQKGRDTDAMMVLQQIYPEGYNVEPVLADMKESIDRDTAAQLAVGWRFLCAPSPALRRMMMVGIGTAVAQQAVGIDAIQYYLIDVIRDSGVDSREGQSIVLMILGGIKLLFIFVGGKCFDRSGRRILFFVSLSGMTLALLIVAFGFLIDQTLSTIATVIGLGLYLAFFSVGMGPGAWLIPSEVFSTVVRAKAMSVATFMNRAVATLMASTFLSTKELIGWAAFFFLMAVVCMLVLGFLWMYLPETKGRRYV